MHKTFLDLVLYAEFKRINLDIVYTRANYGGYVANAGVYLDVTGIKWAVAFKNRTPFTLLRTSGILGWVVPEQGGNPGWVPYGRSKIPLWFSSKYEFPGWVNTNSRVVLKKLPGNPGWVVAAQNFQGVDIRLGGPNRGSLVFKC